MKELIEAFRALRNAPRALWLVIFAFSVDAMAYFGALPLMKAYIGQDIGIAPEWASAWVSVFTCALSLVMLFAGGPVESRFGIRKGIMLALILCLGGRALYSSAPWLGGAATLAVSLAIVAVAEGIMQPIAYAGVKRYTSEKNAAMGFALLYAMMNLGAASIGPISAKVRTTFDARHAAGASTLSGFNAVNWVCVGITGVALIVFTLAMTKRAEAQTVRNTEAPKPGADDGATAASAPTRSPFKDPRFLFFIFMLLPVRTLFAHQWLTMPEYVLRAYPDNVADRMEWLVDSINPIIIFFGVPLFTAFTKRVHVLTMMIIGSAVSASATFLLSFGPHTPLLIGYFVMFSVGEALWSARFLEYAAELAPEGRVAQYMGVASLPWFVAKGTTGFYSGWVLEHFCPADGPQSTGAMWTIYGLIALTSPVGLLLARKWVLKGMDPKKEEPVALAA